MAYIPARSGLIRSGVTYAGWTPPSFTIKVAGADATTTFLAEGSLAITLTSRNEPWTCGFSTHGFAPTIDDDLVVLYATPNDYLFAGQITELETHVVSAQSGTTVWHGMASGRRAQLNNGERVFAQYRATGINSAVADLLARFAPTPARVGYIPQSLGNVEAITFDGVLVTDALDQLAAIAKAEWNVDAETVVSMYVTPAEPTLPTLVNSSTIRDLVYRQDGTQKRADVWVRGKGSPSPLGASLRSGDTTVGVEDLEPFAFPPLEGTGAFAYAMSGHTIFKYSGRSGIRGAGTLTGVLPYISPASGAYDDEIASGADVRVLGIGPGTDPGFLRVEIVDAPTLAWADSQTQAENEVAARSATMKGLQYTTTHRHTQPGMFVPVSITAPLTISETFQIHTVTLDAQGPIRGTHVTFARRVQTNPVSRRRLTDLLKPLN